MGGGDSVDGNGHADYNSCNHVVYRRGGLPVYLNLNFFLKFEVLKSALAFKYLWFSSVSLKQNIN